MTRSTSQRPGPVCPHCGHEADRDEVDSIARGSTEGRVAVDCQACARPFWVNVGANPAPTPCTAAGQR